MKANKIWFVGEMSIMVHNKKWFYGFILLFLGNTLLLRSTEFSIILSIIMILYRIFIHYTDWKRTVWSEKNY